MSSNRSRTNRAIVDFDESSQSQASNRRKASNQEPPNDAAEYEVLVYDCARFILLHEHTKIPVKQTEISKYMRENHLLKGSDIAQIIEEAGKRLFADFGFTLVEIFVSIGKAFYLQNSFNYKLVSLGSENPVAASDNMIVENNDTSDDEFDPKADTNTAQINMEDLTYEEILENAKLVILCIAFSAIMFNDDSETVTEKKLLSSLEEAGFDINDHIETGHDMPRLSIKKLVCEEFVRMGYLGKTKKPSNDISNPTEYIYHLGLRFKLEFKQLEIIKFFKSFYQFSDTQLDQYTRKAVNNDQLANENRINLGQQALAKIGSQTAASQRTLSVAGTSFASQGPINSTPRSQRIQMNSNSTLTVSQLDFSSIPHPSNASTPKRRGRKRISSD